MVGSRTMASLCLGIGLAAHPLPAVIIDTVLVGDPDNASDMRFGTPGYGAVGYTYRIGKYEVTAGEYAQFLNSVAGIDTHGLYQPTMADQTLGSGITRSGAGTMASPYVYSVTPSFENRPVNCVNWGNAARFANWLHNGQPTGGQSLSTTEDGAYYLNGATGTALMSVPRKAGSRWAITSENEWYKAAYYRGGSTNAGYWDYPTRSNTVPGRDLLDASGNNANYFGAPTPIQSPYYTTAVGEFQNSPGPYGTFDQGGNVWEWNEATFNDRYRGLRGGSFWHHETYLFPSRRNNTTPDTANVYIGFRVSEVPEPSTWTACLAAGAISLLRRRNRGRQPCGL